MAIKFSWEKIVEGRFKMSLDEAWELESGKNKNDEKIWYQRIAIKHDGYIILKSLDPVLFEAWTPKQKQTLRIIANKYPEIVIDEYYEGQEGSIVFSPKYLHEVAEILGAKKKRKLTEIKKEELAERIKKYRFKP